MKNKKSQWLLIVGIVALILGAIALVCTMVFEFLNQKTLFAIFGICLAVLGPLGLVLIIVKFIFFNDEISSVQKTPEVKTYQYNENDIPIVDIKEYKKSKDEILYDQYVELYNEHIITEEDLEKKRIELLGK